MQKRTVITDKAGKVVGSARGGKSGDIEGGVIPLAGQKIHEVEVPPEIDKIESPLEAHKALGKLIKNK